MNLYYISVIIVIASNVLYHISQKSISGTINPAISLMVTYTVALILSFGLYFIFPAQEGILNGFKRLNWASYALGASILGLEMGFLLAYRAGWNISTVALFTNICIAIILIPIGLLFYKEHVNPVNIIGIVLSIAGVVCISQK